MEASWILDTTLIIYLAIGFYGKIYRSWHLKKIVHSWSYFCDNNFIISTDTLCCAYHVELSRSLPRAVLVGALDSGCLQFILSCFILEAFIQWYFFCALGAVKYCLLATKSVRYIRKICYKLFAVSLDDNRDLNSPGFETAVAIATESISARTLYRTVEKIRRTVGAP